MSRDNSTSFQSWNTEGPNKDTRHWDPQAKQDLQQHFGDYSTLRILEQLSQDQPDVFREIMKDNPNDPQAAVQALAKLNASKGEALRVRAGIQKAAPKARKGWDSTEIARSVRQLLNNGGGGK